MSYGRGKATEVWLSQDGRDWSPQDLPFDPKMTNTSVLPLRESLALVDMYGSLGGWAFDVWTSSDGAHWKRGTSIEALPERPDDQVGATAMSFGDRIAVTATIGPGLCCGLGVRPGGAATATALDSSGLAGSSGRDVRMRAWTTRDGLSWHPNRVRGLGGSTLPAWPHVGTDAFAFRSHGAALHLSRTTDGVNWTDIGALPEDVGPYNVVDAIAIPHGYVLAADTAGFRGITSGSALTIYTSPDGRTWTERLYRIGWQVDALVGVGSTVLLVGHESSEVPDGERPLALVSSDDGATWELSAGWPGMESGCFLGLALRDRLANASIGCSDGIPQILVAELP